jgi:molecular chaperone DnaK (HSP70)
VRAFGIDFGTTNSVLATTTGRTVDTVPLDDPPGAWDGFDRVLPSVIGLSRGLPAFGWTAKKQAGALHAVKRLFATDEDVVDIGGTTLKVEEAAAIFFRHIQKKAAESITEPLDQAVVTIPANSRGRARYRTKLSAGLAGIEVLALINEPTAAAIAHSRAIGRDQRILVFDWGGGTLDVTVLQSIDGVFIEQASKGIQRLGGIDVDEAFRQQVLPQVSAASSWTPVETAEFHLNLELAKIQLSSATEAELLLPGSGSVTVTRAMFESAIRSLVERSLEPVRTCLAESPGRIDHLVMVGGSSKIPLAQHSVAEVVGVDPSLDVDPMTAIAEGAAIAAGVLSGTIDDVDFFVGTEHALGTIVNNPDSPAEGEFAVLISRNTKLPAEATDSYKPALDFQETVNVQVIEGDPEQSVTHEDNVILKAWDVTLPDPRPASEAGFAVRYEYDVDGILHVTATDHQTGKVFLDEELTFGAGQDKRALRDMGKHVDALMSGDASAAPVGEAPSSTPSALSDASQQSLRKARDKILPFVDDEDRAAIEPLIAELEQATAQDEEGARGALERELRRHSYLL